jgi:nitrogen fixation protein NifQ
MELAGGAADFLMTFARQRSDADSRALALILSHRCACAHAPYRRALGLDTDEVRTLLGHYFPGAPAEGCWRRLGQPDGRPCIHDAADSTPDHGRFSQSLMEQEEQDLCRLFLNHASGPGLWPVVFARLIARACMEPDHLWMSLGLENRRQLSGLLFRHFAPLAEKNSRDMRWKKFFYKLLCDEEKVWGCTASSCEICPHQPECYAPEL